MAGAFYQYAMIAAWVGFFIAAYSTIANDSIQTIGTFINSNKQRKWWILWLFIGGIFLATSGYSWWANAGDVSYQRLTAKGFETTPTDFSFLQVAAPIFLLVLTRLRIPVSTSLLILSCFATSFSGFQKVLIKSFSGYALAFVVAIVVWLLVSKSLAMYMKENKPSKWWTPAQWLTTGFLWSLWLQQDMSNLAIFLPRQLSVYEFAGFAGIIFAGLGVLFYMRGEKVQEVVEEKTHIEDVRSATIVDLVYAFILYYFKMKSNIPMSTTWVFVGLLSGREIAMAITKTGRNWKQTLRLVAKDFVYITIGLIVSLALALAVNMELFLQ